MNTRTFSFLIVLGGLPFFGGCVGELADPDPQGSVLSEELKEGVTACTASPNPVEVGSPFRIRMSGLNPRWSMSVELVGPLHEELAATVDADGTLELTHSVAEAGTWTVAIWKGDNHEKPRATCSFRSVSSSCSPLDCAGAGAECGTVEDGCGGTLACGSCPDGQACGGDGVPNACGSDSSGADPCGDGTCAADEDCGSCEADCGACSPEPGTLGLVVVDAEADRDLQPLDDGAELDVATLGSALSLRAEVTATGHDSVLFVLDGATYQTENSEPYAMAGDRDGDYHAWDLSVGSYLLDVQAYAGPDGTGDLLASTTVAFSLVDGGSSPCVPLDCASVGVDCGTVPDGCGGTLDCGDCPSSDPGGFPTADTTGIAGVGFSESDLSPSPVVSGRWTITQPGVYTDFIHLGPIDVEATGVTLRRCLVRGSTRGPLIRNRGDDLLVEDCTIIGTGTQLDVDICAASIAHGNYVARRVDASGCADGFKLGGTFVTVEDSFIHDLMKAAGDSGSGSGTHNDGFQLNGSSSAGAITVRGNRTSFQHCTSNRQFQLGGNADMLIIEDNFFSGLHGILNVGSGIASGVFQNNVLAGSPDRGPFTWGGLFYSGDGMSNITVTGNRFETGESADSGPSDSYVCVE